MSSSRYVYEYYIVHSRADGSCVALRISARVGLSPARRWAGAAGPQVKLFDGLIWFCMPWERLSAYSVRTLSL